MIHDNDNNQPRTGTPSSKRRSSSSIRFKSPVSETSPPSCYSSGMSNSSNSSCDLANSESETSLNQIGIYLANSGSIIENNDSLEPIFKRGIDVIDFVARTLNVHSDVVLIIDRNGKKLKNDSMCSEMFKNSDQLFVFIAKNWLDTTLKECMEIKEQSKKSITHDEQRLFQDLLDCCMKQYDAIQAIVKYFNSMKDKAQEITESIKKRIPELTKMNLSKLKNIYVNNNITNMGHPKSLNEHFNNVQEQMKTFIEKFNPRLEELNKISFGISLNTDKIENLFLEMTATRDDPDKWMNCIIELRSTLNTILMSDVYQQFLNLSKLSHTQSILSHFYPRFKAMDHMDDIYNLTLLELHQRNLFCGRLQTTIDELNKLIRQENERRSSFTAMIKDFEKTHAYRYLCSLVPQLSHRVQEMEQQCNQTPDIVLSESEFNSTIIKYNTLYEQYRIKYSSPEMEQISYYSMLTFKTLSSIEQIKSSKDNIDESEKKNFEQDYLESVTEIQNLTMEVDSLKSEIDRFKHDNYKLELEIRNKHNLEMEIQNLQTKITSIEKEQNSTLKENETLRSSISDYETQLNMLRKQISTMTEKQTLMEEQYESLQNEHKQTIEKYQQVLQKSDKLQNDYEDDTEQLRKQISGLQKENSILIENELQLKKKISDLENENVCLKATHEEQEKQRQSTISSQDQEISDLKKKLHSLENEKREMIQNHMTSSQMEESQRSELEKKVETLNKKLERAQGNIKDLTESHAMEMDSIRKQLEDCERSRQEIESRNVKLALDFHNLASEIQTNKEDHYLREAKTVSYLSVLDTLLGELMAYLVHNYDLCEKLPDLGARAEDIKYLHDELREVLKNFNTESVDFSVVRRIEDVIRLIVKELDHPNKTNNNQRLV
ncbi:hypothetical protein C9374_012809 [Naegleria lovaniensis]|uniref:Uncharacterized protein n=1 Tax=Naegleria lovaniensis TaxID=51637 RepID=A0AA88KHU1_NAELO|nr:uncharacterized protein C9374_012809 [Naegleria lovaniensis]KAG2373207.1 hypothetical protein C9374_012809 [Naegleria lovaniensis]